MDWNDDDLDDRDGSYYEAEDNTGALNFNTPNNSLLDDYEREQGEHDDDDPQADGDISSLEDAEGAEASDDLDPQHIVEALQAAINTNDVIEVLDELRPLFGVTWLEVNGRIKLFGEPEDKYMARRWLLSRRRYMSKDGRHEWSEQHNLREGQVKDRRDAVIRNAAARYHYHQRKAAGLLTPRKKAETLEEKVEASVKIKLQRVRKTPEFEALPTKEAKDAYIEQVKADYEVSAKKRLEGKALRAETKRTKAEQGHAIKALRSQGHTVAEAKRATLELTDRLVEISVLIAHGPTALHTEADLRLLADEAMLINQRIHELSGREQ